jgi:ketosteroid isomerase-like protein
MVLACLSVALFVALVGVAAMPAQQVFTPDLKGDDSAANEIFRLEDGAMEQWRQGNPLRWAEISADDVIYVDPGLAAPVVGIEAYTTYLEALAGKVKYDGSEYVKPRVALYGDTAVLTYNYHSLSRDKSGTLQRGSFWNTTQVYQRRAGLWKIIHSHWSYIGHRQPPEVQVPVPVRAPEAGPEGVAAELLALEAGAMERWRKGDPYGFTDISAPEVTYFDSCTPSRLDGLAELKAEYKKRENKIFYDAMEFIDPRVRAGGDAAVLFYRFFSTVLNPDGSVRSRTPWNCSEVFARIGGRWRIVHTHWSCIQGRREAGGF